MLDHAASVALGSLPGGLNPGDVETEDRLRRRREMAFAQFVRLHEREMRHVAMVYVRNSFTADEVVQETWLAVFEGIARFEGRCSLKTWIYRILINLAKTRGQRDARTISMSAWHEDRSDTSEDPAQSVGRNPGANPRRLSAPWGDSPAAWSTPHDHLSRREMTKVVVQAIDDLPVGQSTVIRLRDVRGLPAEEVCNLLAISDGFQRVQLHRARVRVRAALAAHLDGVA